MLITKSKIKITQVGNALFPLRNQFYEFDFVNEIEINSSWQNLSDTAKITVPQKIKFVDNYGIAYSWDGKNIGGGGDKGAPLIMRGDKVSISLGYDYYDAQKSKRVLEMNEVFTGYVSEVESKRPMTIYCTDNMWKLSQTQAPNKTWRGYTLQQIVAELIKGTGFTIAHPEVETKVGDLVTQNQTVAEVLEFIRRNYKIESFFKGNKLYTAAFRYWPDDVKEHVFRFQENIISDDLKYQRIDDVVMGVECFSYEKFSSGTRKDGKPKKSAKRLSVFGYYERGNLVFYDEKPAGFEGEIRTLNLFAASKEDLKDQAQKNIYRLIYTGFKGYFVTFGLPFVRHGDNCIIRDVILPDRDGTYKCKANQITFGQGGFRQKIELDLRIDSFKESDIKAGL